MVHFLGDGTLREVPLAIAKPTGYSVKIANKSTLSHDIQSDNALHVCLCYYMTVLITAPWCLTVDLSNNPLPQGPFSYRAAQKL